MKRREEKRRGERRREERRREENTEKIGMKRKWRVLAQPPYSQRGNGK